MYRNIAYEIRKTEDKKDAQGFIILWTWDENGNPIRKEAPHNSHLMYKDPNGEYMSIFKDRLTKIEFASRNHLYKWKRENPNVKCYDAFSPEQEFLLKEYAGKNESIDFTKHQLRKQYIDIEVAVQEDFPQPAEAKYPINALTVYDSFLKEYHVWVFERHEWCVPGAIKWEVKEGDVFGDVQWKKGYPGGKVVFHVFETEYAFWCDYLEWQSKNVPDVITGWNVEGFDIPYIINRAKKAVGEARLNKISPIGTIRSYERKQRTKSGERIICSYEIKGITVLDYMILYENKFGPSTAPSYKLNSIAMDELGHGKLEYKGSIKEFYKTDFQTFVKYNIIDVQLIVELDAKLNYLELARKICNMGLCPYFGIYTSSPYILGAIAMEAKNRNNEYLMTDDRVDKEGLEVTFPGAFVYETKVGYYRLGVSSLDLNSLYPNIMINLNISPETKVGRIICADENFTEVYFPKKDVHLKIKTSELADKFKGKFTISSNNIIYMSPDVQVGIIPSFLSRLYQLRKSTKNAAIAMKKEIGEVLEPALENCTDKAEKKRLKAELIEKKTQMQILDDTQQAYKIYLNSIYGQLGSKWFPLFDLDNAASVTLSGQTIIKEAMDFIETQFTSMKKTPEETIVIAGDTDSVYFDCQYVVEQVLGRRLEGRMKKEDISLVVDYLDNEFVPLVNAKCSEITRERFFSPLKNIEFKRESFCDVAAFLAKKHYVLHIMNLEGVMKEKWKAAGIAIKKNELPPIIKEKLKYIIYNAMLEKWDNQKFSDHLGNLWVEFCQMPPDVFALNRGYKKEKKSDGFMSAEKGAGAQAKASLYYNNVLADMELRGKYNEINAGDVVRLMYVKTTNRYGIGIIGWTDTYPPEFSQVFEPDYEKMFEGLFMKPLENFIEIFGWLNRHPAYAGEADVFDL